MKWSECLHQGTRRRVPHDDAHYVMEPHQPNLVTLGVCQAPRAFFRPPTAREFVHLPARTEVFARASFRAAICRLYQSPGEEFVGFPFCRTHRRLRGVSEAYQSTSRVFSRSAIVNRLHGGLGVRHLFA